MANALTPGNRTQMSARAGIKQYKEVIYRSIASFTEQANLKKGDEVDRPYRSDLVSGSYTKATAVTAQDITYTSEKLSIDTQRTILFYLDDIDKVQNEYNTRMLWGDEIGKRLSIDIDAFFLYNAVNAADSMDDGDISGTAGNAVVLSTSNVLNWVSKINKKLDVLNVSRGKERFLAISPQAYDIIFQYISGKDTGLADATLKSGIMQGNGYLGTIGGLMLYMSNNLTGSAIWTPVDNPSNTATITIEGITFTFVSTIGTTAGNILQTTDTSATLTLLTAFINGGGLETATGCTAATCQSLSAANQRIVSKWSAAVDDTTATLITVYVKGGSYLTLTTSVAADAWTAEQQHCLAGKKGCIDSVVQIAPSIDSQKMLSNGKFGVNVGALTVFGHKMYYQGTLESLDVQLDSSSF